MALTRLPLIISGIDYTEAANRTGYSITYEERTGPNGFTSLNGMKEIDLLRYVPIITWPLNALKVGELAQLQDAALQATYVPITYFDIHNNDKKTSYFHATFGTISVPLLTATGCWVKDGIALTLTGR